MVDIHRIVAVPPRRLSPAQFRLDVPPQMSKRPRVKPWQASDECMESMEDDGNFRVYQYGEDGTQLAGLFREYSDGVLHMVAGSRRKSDRTTAGLMYWHEGMSLYVGAGGTQSWAKQCSKHALSRVDTGQATVITADSDERFPEEVSESETDNDAESDDGVESEDDAESDDDSSQEEERQRCAAQEREPKRLKRLEAPAPHSPDDFKSKVQKIRHDLEIDADVPLTKLVRQANEQFDLANEGSLLAQVDAITEWLA